MLWMKMTNREIEHAVSVVYEKYVQRGNSHKQLNSIMQSEGIKFRKVSSVNVGFVGALTRGNNGQCYIMVNSDIGISGRVNFTIVHELGHYFLNHHLQFNHFYCTESDILEETDATLIIEREANHFASSFLMPEQKIKSAFLSILRNSRKAKVKDFLHVKNDFTFGIWCGVRDSLMKRYGVSEAALRYRLRYLKLAKFDFRGV